MQISADRFVTPEERTRMRFELPPRERIFDWFPCPECGRESPMMNPDSCCHSQLHECPACNHTFEVR